MTHKLPISEKAWKVKWRHISEGHYLSDDVVYAETRGKAKSKWMGILCDYKLCRDEEITFKNAPVVRCPDEDKLWCEGESLSQYQIRHREIEKEKQKQGYEILADPKITHCYIRKNGSYYRPNCCGYTEFQLFAGVYTKEEAIKEVSHCSDLFAIPINTEEHNTYLQKQISEIQSRLI